MKPAIPHRLVTNVQRFVREHNLTGTGIVAVSGGADSVALYRALHGLFHDSIIVVHFNHQLRGAESNDDETFVRELAQSLNCECVTRRLDIPPDENLESAARRLRYQCLDEIAKQSGAKWVATGHTADDQAETLLHRLVRGTGLQGLRGIAPVRGSIVRPLLSTSRQDVVAYLLELNQSYRTDSSNTDRRFTRNRIRHELVPIMKEINPELVSVFGRLAVQATDTFEYVVAQVNLLLDQAERPRAGAILVFDQDPIQAAPSLLACELFRHVWQREGWPLDAMTHDHWLRVASLQVGDYPGGVRLRRVGTVIQLGRTQV